MNFTKYKFTNQYSFTGTVNGITNYVSLDIFDNDVLQSNVTLPGPGTPGNQTVYTIQRQLNAMTLAGLVTDGIFGPLSWGKLLK